MAIITNSLIYDSIGLVVALIVGLLTYAKWTYGYWTRKGVYSKPATFPSGNAQDVLKAKQNMGDFFKDLYLEFKAKGLKHGGAYFLLKKFYIPVDLNIVKSIMQNDFQHFVNHGAYHNEKDDPLSAHLFSLEDERWKTMRAKLTPTFTSGKMKMMFTILVECSKLLDQKLQDTSETREPLDIRDILQRFTMDIISSCAFGLETNTMNNPESDFAVHGKLVLAPNFRNNYRNMMSLFFNHDFLRFCKMKMFHEDATDFFMDIVKKTVEYREKNNVYRNDFMHLLLQLKNRGNVFDDEKISDENGKQGLSLEEVAAQAFIFFFAGYETSSTAMTFALYELAQRPDIQEKMREEINRVLEKHGGKVTYDAIKEMTYMDQVLNESLRKYPPLPILMRRCNKEYKVPGTDLIIEKGEDVGISTLGIQHDPEYYPNPEVFDPDRFSAENKVKRPLFSWIPFGEGPRACIGLRFGIMQAKVGLLTILKDYNVTLDKKTKVPLRFSPNGFILVADGGVWINVERNNLN